MSASADKTLIVWRGEDEELPQPQLWLRGHTLAVVRGGERAAGARGTSTQACSPPTYRYSSGAAW